MTTPQPMARTIDVHGVRTSLIDTGGPGPPLLLVHGLGAHSGFWAHQVPRWAESFRVIAPDLPGWGASAAPDAPYTPRYYAAHLDGLLAALGIERVSLVGHSMGGQISLTWVLGQPDRVDRLVLSAPAGIQTFSEAEGQLIRNFWSPERLAHRSEDDLRTGFGLAFGRHGDDVERLLQERIAIAGTPREAVLARTTLRSMLGMLEQPVFARLGQIEAPTLVVFGTADAMIPGQALRPHETPEDVGQRAVAAIRGARLVMIRGAGHTPHHDDPDAFHAGVDPFLAASVPR